MDRQPKDIIQRKPYSRNMDLLRHESESKTERYDPIDYTAFGFRIYCFQSKCLFSDRVDFDFIDCHLLQERLVDGRNDQSQYSDFTHEPR